MTPNGNLEESFLGIVYNSFTNKGNFAADWNTSKKTGVNTPVLRLLRRVRHIFDQDPASPGGAVHRNVCHRLHQFAILENGAAARLNSFLQIAFEIRQ